MHYLYVSILESPFPMLGFDMKRTWVMCTASSLGLKYEHNIQEKRREKWSLNGYFLNICETHVNAFFLFFLKIVIITVFFISKDVACPLFFEVLIISSLIFC